MDLYGAFDDHHWIHLFEIDGVIAATAGLLLQLLVLMLDQRQRAALVPFVVCGLYCWGAYLVQQKGWAYQFLTAQLFLFLGQGVLVTGGLAGLRGIRRTQVTLALSIGVTILMILNVVNAIKRQPGFPTIVPVAGALAGAHRGDSIYAFSTQVTPMFPAVPTLGLKWASRYAYLWPLLELARVDCGLDPARKDRFERTYRGPFVDSVIDDFTRYAPDYVLVDRRNVDMLPADFDILSMFLGNPRFARIWSGYRQIGSIYLTPHTFDFDVYQKVAKDAPASAAPSLK
jgi:hypothetical protein